MGRKSVLYCDNCRSEEGVQKLHLDHPFMFKLDQLEHCVRLSLDVVELCPDCRTLCLDAIERAVSEALDAIRNSKEVA